MGICQELYDLSADIGEATNLYAEYPDLVAELQSRIDACRLDLGDQAAGIEGENPRPIGRVDHPQTLTHYDPEHPYMIALYDLKDRG